uniref:Uncharacterized protein n=1 Tax=Pyxicephalus adspersus TaxID=30357 RepID=A0AAV3A6W4_PYXAD|nr:TPA: hypothetical protein GDO54_018061 [Pyxicephalus adspersus]
MENGENICRVLVAFGNYTLYICNYFLFRSVVSADISYLACLRRDHDRQMTTDDKGSEGRRASAAGCHSLVLPPP